MAEQARIGVIGMGTMGAALALNLAECGIRVAVYNRSADKARAVVAGAGALASRMTAVADLEELVAAIAPPRTVLMMVPAGDAVRQTVAALRPRLARGDVLIDAGNADFRDTQAIAAALEGTGIGYLGLGVSGGEDGARHGPSLMAGGDRDAWERVRDIFEAIAARHASVPCAGWFGPDGAGHFVKTVHNGIEYADMELIAEVYGLLRRGAGRAGGGDGGGRGGQTPEAIAEILAAWNAGPLRSYLLEITAEVLRATDPATGAPLVDAVLDSAGQKGTGRWTAIEALRLGRPASTIEAAVGARAWSSMRRARAAGARALPAAPGPAPELSETDLARALLAARTLAFGQGLAILEAASEEHGWDMDRAAVAEVWRAGCIIRSALLDDIAAALRAGLPEGQLHLAPAFRGALSAGLPALRRVVATAAMSGVPVPGFSAALGFAETMRSARTTADLIQLQRDFFGRHGFGRVDAEGVHHGPWAE